MSLHFNDHSQYFVQDRQHFSPLLEKLGRSRAGGSVAVVTTASHAAEWSEHMQSLPQPIAPVVMEDNQQVVQEVCSTLAAHGVAIVQLEVN